MVSRAESQAIRQSAPFRLLRGLRFRGLERSEAYEVARCRKMRAFSRVRTEGGWYLLVVLPDTEAALETRFWDVVGPTAGRRNAFSVLLPVSMLWRITPYALQLQVLAFLAAISFVRV